MNNQTGRLGQPGGLIRSILFTAGLSYAVNYVGPPTRAGEIQVFSAFLWLLLFSFVVSLLAETIWLIGSAVQWFGARKASGLKGTARWAKTLHELRPDVKWRGWGPYWGTFKGKEIISDFSSNALLVGPAGVGKGVRVLIQTILSIRASKTIIDFKGELSVMLATRLRKLGQKVYILNLGDLWTEHLGSSERYNPLCVIWDCFMTRGWLLDLTDRVFEMSMQLCPEPETTTGSQTDNSHFRDVSRRWLQFAIQFICMVYGDKAHLGHVNAMISNRAQLLKDALWAAGKLETSDGMTASMPIETMPWTAAHDKSELTNYIAHFRDLADGVAESLLEDDSRSASSFLTGAQNAMERFNKTTRTHKALSTSTFRFSEQKDGKSVSVFIVTDSTKLNAQKDALGLIQWCMFQELKSHPNKSAPVYLIADEATNFRLSELGSLLTWGRGYGLRILIVIQSISAFVRVYGESVLATLLNETEIKLFLAGQREPRVLKLIKEMLGDGSKIVTSHRGGGRSGPLSIDGEDYREEGRPLLTEDEIRRLDTSKGILFIREKRPILATMPLIASIAPWRKQIGINPFHGKPFLKRVQLRIRR